MRTALFLLLFHICLVSFAQDAEFPDYRSKKENFSRMQEKDIRSELASFTIAGIDESISKSPLKSIPETDYGKNFMTFQGNNIQVTVRSGMFDPSKHKLGYYQSKYLVKIDNKPYFGNYGTLPKNTVESVTVIMDKDTIHVPPVALADLYNPGFTYSDASGVVKSHNAVYISNDKRKIYVYMLNREAIGSYEVTWVIQDKKYLRRVIDFGLLK